MPADLPAPPPLRDGQSLFLDFDGTLVDIAERPDAVLVDEGLTTLLGALAARLGPRLAIVSGRSVAQLDDLLGAAVAEVALVGSHGSETRWAGAPARPERPAALAAVEADLAAFSDANPGTILESKSFGVALHYRGAPDAEGAAEALAARLAEDHGLTLQRGKMMVELRVAGSKGAGVEALMRRPELAGSRPVFVGDDVTDEAGFAAAARLGGWGVLVGPMRETAALHRLESVAAVRDWLSPALEETG